MIEKRLAILLAAAVMILSACTQSAPQTVAPTELPTQEQQPVAVQPSTAQPTAVRPTLALPTPTQAMVNECLECHIDKQRLVDTAKPEEVQEKESEGVG